MLTIEINETYSAQYSAKSWYVVDKRTDQPVSGTAHPRFPDALIEARELSAA